VPPVAPPAITAGDGATVVLRRNVFIGFGAAPVSGLPEADREPVRTGNVVVPSIPSTSR
jgi:hypothetical protein